MSTCLKRWAPGRRVSLVESVPALLQSRLLWGESGCERSAVTRLLFPLRSINQSSSHVRALRKQKRDFTPINGWSKGINAAGNKGRVNGLRRDYRTTRSRPGLLSFLWIFFTLLPIYSSWNPSFGRKIKQDTEPCVLMACDQAWTPRHGHTVWRKIDLWGCFHLHLVAMTLTSIGSWSDESPGTSTSK